MQAKLWRGESEVHHYYDGLMRMFGRLSCYVMPKLMKLGPGDTRQQLSGRGLCHQTRVVTANPRQRNIYGPVINIGHQINRARGQELSGFIHDESLVSSLLEHTVLHDPFMACFRQVDVEGWRNEAWRSVNLMWRYHKEERAVTNSRPELELIFGLCSEPSMWQLTGFEHECRSLAGTERRDGINQA